MFVPSTQLHVTAQVIFETDATVVSGAESSADGGMFLHQMGRQVSKAADSMQFVLAAAEGLEIGLPVAEVSNQVHTDCSETSVFRWSGALSTTLWIEG